MDRIKVGDTVEVLCHQGAIGIVTQIAGDFVRVRIPTLSDSPLTEAVPRHDLRNFSKRRIYEDALAAVCPGACNLSGLVRGLSEAMKYIWFEAHGIGSGTSFVNKHPIVTLYLSQMELLNNPSFYHDAFRDALEDVRHVLREMGERQVASEVC